MCHEKSIAGIEPAYCMSAAVTAWIGLKLILRVVWISTKCMSGWAGLGVLSPVVNHMNLRRTITINISGNFQDKLWSFIPPQNFQFTSSPFSQSECACI